MFAKREVLSRVEIRVSRQQACIALPFETQADREKTRLSLKELTIANMYN